MSRHKICMHLFSHIRQYNLAKTNVKNITKFTGLGLGIGVGSLGALPFQVHENNVVANVNGALRFLRFVYCFLYDV